ncbi:diguanylate cyclase (GGDEF domain), partial [Candidatus Thiomargarita nelsonii]
MEQLIKQTLDTLARLANSQLVALFRVLENQNGGVVGVFKQGQVILHSNERKIKFKDTPFAKIISAGQTQTYPCLIVKKWSLPFPTYKQTNSGFECLCLPLLGGESKPVAGVVVVAQKNGISIPSERLQMLKMLAPLMASILENVSTEREQIIESVTLEPLTNLYTRPYFEIRLQEEMTIIHRHGGILSILLIDIDHFNKINSSG